jgi:hypothetical protein
MFLQFKYCRDFGMFYYFDVNTIIITLGIPVLSL